MSQFYDQASLVMVPSGYKAGKVYSQKPLTTDGELSFTRASTATRVNSSGLIESVATGVPRLDYSGGCPSLLLEPQRTNGITFSENQGPSGTNWYPSTTWTVTNNTVTSPSGYQDADTLTETATYGFHSAYYNGGIATGYTGTYTISAFAKYNGRIFVLNPYPTGAGRTYYDLQNGTVLQTGTGITASIEDYGGGWYRCICTGTFSSQNVTFEHMLASAVGTLQYTGDGTSGVHIWGCMAEAGAYATSYIPTLSTAVTRLADFAQKSSISSLFGSTEGTFFCELTYTDVSSIPIFLASSINSFFNYATYLQFGGAKITYNVYSGGTQQVIITSSSNFTEGQKVKIAFAYKQNDFAIYVNGVSEGTDNAGLISTSLAGIQVGRWVDVTDTFQYFGKIDQAVLFPTRLSNADLATLTA